MSAWESVSVQSDAYRDSDHLSRRRARLQRSSALLSSRSAMSQADSEVREEEVVYVGHGRRATFVEHMMARMEQHGLRRCVCSEDPGTSYAVTATVLAEEAHTCTAMRDTPVCQDDTRASAQSSPSHGPDDSASCQRSHTPSVHDRPRGEGSAVPVTAPSCSLHAESHRRPVDATLRERYYYLCVPCELRLTRMSEQAATVSMLQDVHYHFASAAHRRLAAWMADPDIDLTLVQTPHVHPVSYYTGVTINGVPLLLSRRPGGGICSTHSRMSSGACRAAVCLPARLRGVVVV